MGTYRVEESRDRIIANHTALAMTVAKKFFSTQAKKLRRLGVELGDVQAEASLLLIEIVDKWDRECAFDQFCEKELNDKLRGRIRVLTWEDRDHSEVQASPVFWSADRPDDADSRHGVCPSRRNGAPLWGNQSSGEVSLLERLELAKSHLTEEEFIVAQKAADGFTDIEIKDQLGIHRTTVAKRRESALQKLSQIRGELYE